MEMPSYDGIIEEWKVELIIGRAKKHGIKPHEIPDVLQECVLAVLDVKYDDAHVSGATERTLLVAIVDNLIRKMKRTERRYQMHVERLGETASEFSSEEIDIQALEVADIIETLTPQEKMVCKGLAEGASKAQIAKELGCDWHTVHNVVQRLRQHFAAFIDPDVSNDRCVTANAAVPAGFAGSPASERFINNADLSSYEDEDARRQ